MEEHLGLGMGIMKKTFLPAVVAGAFVASVSYEALAVDTTNIYLSNGSTSNLYIIDPSDGSVLDGPVNIGATSHAIALKPGNETVVAIGRNKPNPVIEVPVTSNTLGAPVEVCSMLSIQFDILVQAAYAPDGTLYAGSDSDKMFKVDPDTCTVSDVGTPKLVIANTTINLSGIDFAFGEDGTMWAASNATDKVYTVDISTAGVYIFTPVGAGFGSNTFTGLAFDDDVLLGSRNEAGGGSALVDLSNGSVGTVIPITAFDVAGGDMANGLLAQVVEVDIKPNSYPSCFNENGKGKIPIAILGSELLDVSEIDPSTIQLADGSGLGSGFLSVSEHKKKAYQCSIADYDPDGYNEENFAPDEEYIPENDLLQPDEYPDLICQLEDTDDGVFSKDSTEGIVTAQLNDGTNIEAIGDVCITQETPADEPS